MVTPSSSFLMMVRGQVAVLVSVRIRSGVGEHFAAHPAPGQRAESPSFRVEGC